MLLLFTYYSAAGSIVKKGVFVFDVIPKMLREKKKKSVMFSDMVVISKTTYKILIQNSLETTASKKITCLKKV